MIACIYFIILAVNSADDMVEGDYYRQGLAINESLAEERLSAALGLEVSIQLEQGRYLVPKLDAGDSSVAIQSMIFQHPFEDSLDFHMPVQSGSRYPLPPEVPIASRWYIELRGDSSQGVWQLKGDHDFRNSSTAYLQP